MQGYVMLRREGGKELLENDPKAYLLLSQIALRARRIALKYAKIPLEPNQALIGDHEKINLTRGEYRRALSRLKRYGLIEYATTNSGAVVTIINTSVFDINAEEPSKSSIKTTQKEPAKSHQKTNKEPSDSHPTTIKAPLTNNVKMQQHRLVEHSINASKIFKGQKVFPSAMVKNKA